ncbi:MAG: hypothetical protein ACKO5M_01320 [Vulcanococcus sp.]
MRALAAANPEAAMNPRGPDLLEVALVGVILALIVFRFTLP